MNNLPIFHCFESDEDVSETSRYTLSILLNSDPLQVFTGRMLPSATLTVLFRGPFLYAVVPACVWHVGCSSLFLVVVPTRTWVWIFKDLMRPATHGCCFGSEAHGVRPYHMRRGITARPPQLEVLSAGQRFTSVSISGVKNGVPTIVVSCNFNY